MVVPPLLAFKASFEGVPVIWVKQFVVSKVLRYARRLQKLYIGSWGFIRHFLGPLHFLQPLSGGCRTRLRIWDEQACLTEHGKSRCENISFYNSCCFLKWKKVNLLQKISFSKLGTQGKKLVAKARKYLRSGMWLKSLGGTCALCSAPPLLTIIEKWSPASQLRTTR